jgi:dihydrofolate synthase/folylpolyglutamate synthase
MRSSGEMTAISRQTGADRALSYEQAINFWYDRINYEQRSPKPSDLKLDRMRALLNVLGNPQDRLRIVHVAGSKGKGSTSALLASVLRQAGYRTGLFTSPHLEHVAERIQVDGEPISPPELAGIMNDVKAAVATLDRQASDGGGVTFFEVATALGFVHFVRRRVDVALVEVGLGGRFDSTNVCRPLLSIITSISFDHTEQLGYTLASIAREKAGIVKPGRPVLSGVTAPEARQVIETICRERGAPLRQIHTDFRFIHTPGCIAPDRTRRARVQVTTERRAWPILELGLLGEHQAANAALAIAAVEQLNQLGLDIPDRAVALGLAAVIWPARLEVFARQPLVVLDCAHNLASAQALVDTLDSSFPLSKAGVSRRLLIFAGSRDKDLAGMLALLGPRFDHLYLTRFGHSPRAVEPEELARIVAQVGDLPHTVCATAATALARARADARPEDQICITGSVFLAGELRPLLRQQEAPNVVVSG